MLAASSTTSVVPPAYLPVLVEGTCTRVLRVKPLPTPAPPAPRRFAVLDCEDAVKWDGLAIALARLFSKEGETWCEPRQTSFVIFLSSHTSQVTPSSRDTTTAAALPGSPPKLGPYT